MLIGITGKSCAGKDYICQIFLNQNPAYREINLDTIGHIALEQKQQAVLDAFPELRADLSEPWGEPEPCKEQRGQKEQSEKKTINRKKLGHLVFRNPAALHKLESILHPHMKKLVLEELNNHSSSATQNQSAQEENAPMDGHTEQKIIINSALLEKLQLLPYCNLVLWVHASTYLRAWRAMRRDKLLFSQFLHRNKAQRTLSIPAFASVSKSYISENSALKNSASERTTSPPFYLIKNNYLINSCASSGIYRQLQSIPQLQQEFATNR